MTEMIKMKIYLDGKKLEKVFMGPTYEDTADKSLSSATIMFHSDSLDAVDAFTPVKVVFNEGLENEIVVDYVVATDNVEPASKVIKIYKHTMVVVEPTKLLEKIIINNIILSNATDTLFQQFVKAVNNIAFYMNDGITGKQALENGNYILLGTKYEFIISKALADKLSIVDGSEFYFEKATAREVLDGVLSKVDSRIKLTRFGLGTSEIYSSMTRIKFYLDLIDYNNYIEVEKPKVLTEGTSNYAETYANTIVAYGANTVGKQTIVQGFENFKSKEATLTTNNAFIQTAFGVVDIVKFEVKIDSELSYDPSTETAPVWTTDEFLNYAKPIDISEYVVDEEYYNSQPSSVKKYLIPYSRYSNEVNANNGYKVLFYSLYNLKNAISRAAIIATSGEENASFYERIEWSGEYSPSKILYRITYYPIFDTYPRISKRSGMINRSRELLQQLSIIDNQSEKMIDIHMHALNLKSKLVRLGNDEYQMDMNHSNPSELLPLLTKIGEYVIYKRTYSVENFVIKTQYLLSKNFNNLAERIALNREKRIYSIPTDFQDCVLYKKYYLAITNKKSEIEHMSTSLMDLNNASFLQLLFSNIVVNKGKSSLSDKELGHICGYCFNQQNGSDMFLLPTTNYVMANTLNFLSKCLDNYSVGYSIGGKILGGNKMRYNPYVDENGELSQVYGFLTNLNNIPSDQIKDMPATKASYHNVLLNDTVHFEKDRQQSLSFNIALEGVTLNKSVFVGDNFYLYNPAMNDKTLALYLYLSENETYNDNSSKCLGYKINCDSKLILCLSVFNSRYRSMQLRMDNVEGAYNKVDDTWTAYTESGQLAQFGSDTGNFVSWAIGDSDRNIFIASNTDPFNGDLLYISIVRHTIIS